MLFSVMPKEKKEDLYDFEEELRTLLELYTDDLARLIVIKGLRRTGKTSLLRVSLNTSKLGYILLDMREFDIPSKVELNGKLRDSLIAITRGKAKHIMDKIRAISVGGLKIELSESEKKDYKSILRKINDWAERKDTYFILVIDEAQEIRKIGFDRYLAFVYDNLPRIKIVLAGSQIGVINQLFDSVEAPLYGRAYEEIQTKRFSVFKSLDFLKKGFTEVNMDVDEEVLKTAVGMLNGLAGWLVLYGVTAYRTKNFDVALEKTIEEGISLVKRELNRFLETRGIGRRRYVIVLKALSTGPKLWKEIKNAIEAKEGKTIGNNQVSAYLQTLVKYGFVEKRDKKYYIPDSMIRKTTARLS